MTIFAFGRLRAGFGRAAVLGALTATGCREAIVIPEPTVTIGASSGWAGSTVVLVATGLTGADTLPTVVIGLDTVTVRYAPPDTLKVTAPDTQGTFTVQLGFRGHSLVTVGTIQLLGGFVDKWTVSPVGGHPVAWPGAGQASLAMALDSGLALVSLRLRSSVQALPDSIFDISCINGPGPAAGGRITVEGRPFPFCGPLVAVRPDSPWVAPDTGPGAGDARFAAQLATGRWIVAWHHGVLSFKRNPSGAWDTASTPYHIEEPYEVVVSPRGDRAIVLGRDYAGIGMPVFGLDSPEPAYLLADYHRLDGAAFSPDGDTLFLAAGRTLRDSEPVLAALRASDGSVLHTARAWAGAYHVVLDPNQPWIYLVGHETSSDPPIIHVYDRATLAPVATLRARVPAYMNGDAYPFLSSAERKLYVVESCSFCGAGPTPIFEFNLLP